MRFLLVPMQPTPNGRLHLGHASGPYLRSDVLARFLRREGHDVRVVTGSDVYENWILLDALRNGRSPGDTCRRFHTLIADDLAHLHVALDDWIDPLDPGHAAPYRTVHENLVDDLLARGQVREVVERFPVSTGSGRYVVGVWLSGRCPNCGAGAGGNACEECGYHFQPSEILEPRSRLDEGPLTWRDVRCQWLVPTDPGRVSAGIEASGAPADVVGVARRYVARTGGRIRLTIPGDWGIDGRHTLPDTVLCNTVYAYSLYCGAVAARLDALPAEPFQVGSDVTTVAFFGIDNAIAGLVGPHAMAAAHGALRPFDHVAVNRFMTLEGEKFSTSRGHAVWVSELVEQTSATGDEVRHHLASRSPEEETTDFRPDEFAAATNELRRTLDRQVGAALRVATGGSDPAVLARLDAALAAQARALRPESVAISAAAVVVDEWLARPSTEAAGGEAATSWLLGLALLAEPIMPTLASGLWQALGLAGRPRTALRAARCAAPQRYELNRGPSMDGAEVEKVVHR